MAYLRHTPVVAILSLAGLALSFYCIHVQQHSETKLAYKPYCDISLNMMCSKVALSPYSHLLALYGLVEPHGPMDISNGHLGVAFYTFMLTYPLGKHVCTSVYFLATVAALMFSGYLCYVMYAILSNISIISAGVAVINALLFATLVGGGRADEVTAEEIAGREHRVEEPAVPRREEKKTK
ncbi:vitamin k epoxide reductase family protein [Besnoitia besnoiti]|uniref:vitamin-K-epoxide reductase (warfarin-sensitive) n=1 Tax=Besnoitia besnoiti TaxID=94643 RepID=A0A2A9M952_BESBE|nr:vitamin k epoxide reductase family protein [Besnoitia besnoiti]PFH34525.1 vitamin k epoxide reductase family protein [Besnoitia besnoiti]